MTRTGGDRGGKAEGCVIDLGRGAAIARVAGWAAVMALSACAEAQTLNLRVERAEDWIAILDRDHGWNDADGCVSVPLNGIEAPGLDPHPKTLFLFGDTIIGDVDANGRRVPGAEFINNSMLYVDGLEPDPAKSEFIYVRNDGHGHPRSTFVPTVAGSEPGDYFWLMEGIALVDKVHLFNIHLRPNLNGGWPLHEGIVMVTIPKESRPPFEDQVQTSVPLYVSTKGDLGPIQFPSCIMSNTKEAGAPHPDGFVYIYGAREDPFVKKAIVARVLPEDFTDFDAWRFWNGTEWVEGIESVAAMTGRISGVYSVTPMADRRFIMVFQEDAIGPNVAIRIGESPTGPWGDLREIYHCPETERDPDIFCYNALAHPHLSKPGELLISYSVNSWDFEDAFWIADIGRPRFIKLIYVGR